MYYNREGHLLTREQYNALLSDPKYRRIALTKVGETRVSTVWLGMMHGDAGDGPLIFETMVFGGAFDHECLRYATEENARWGHKVVVAWVTHGMQYAFPWGMVMSWE